MRDDRPISSFPGPVAREATGRLDDAPASSGGPVPHDATGMVLDSSQVPHATPDGLRQRLLEWVGESDVASTVDANRQRLRMYQDQALRILGWLATDEPRRLTEDGARAATLDDAAYVATFAGAFEKSACGRALLRWQNAGSLDELDPSLAQSFVHECTTLRDSTADQRGSTLARWIRYATGAAAARTPTKKRRSKQPAHGQLSLMERPEREGMRARLAEIPWPDVLRFPHNAGTKRTEAVLEEDLGATSSATLVMGYASLEDVVRLLANPGLTNTRLKLLFGTEPQSYDPKRMPGLTSLEDDIRDYWLERGVSVALSAPILAAQERLRAAKAVEVRIGPRQPRVHAKIYATDRSVIVGSSNLTGPGLHSQLEANVRILPKEAERFAEATLLAEGLYAVGHDFRDGLLELLSQLLSFVGWRDALARACALLLEGDWPKGKYQPHDDINELDPPLWPHQRQGLAQTDWVLRNVGSVLVADATGSGKTRMGAWIIRRAYDMQVSRQHVAPRANPVLISPPGVKDEWRRALHEAALPIEIESQGTLSQPHAVTGATPTSVAHRIEQTELLAVDEAHNYVRNASRRHALLRMHHADQVVLLTATPINRNAADLASMVELLGADNFSDESLAVFKKLRRTRVRSPGDSERSRDIDLIRAELRSFLVRRTRDELNAIVDVDADRYRTSGGRVARYPNLTARRYACGAPPEDLAIIGEIRRLIADLHGVHRLGEEMARPPAFQGSEDTYLKFALRSAPALAQFHILDSLRSSKAALLEHLAGTDVARRHVELPETVRHRSANGIIAASRARAKHRPIWRLSKEARAHAPAWLLDDGTFAEAANRDADCLSRVLDLATRLTETREKIKAAFLAERLRTTGRSVIGFAFHLSSLLVIERELRCLDLDPLVLTGHGGRAAKQRAKSALGLEAAGREPVLALCSDAFNEGFNMQAAGVVVHLDTPTVVRVAEQRAGRIDRMNSPFEEIFVHFPEDPRALRPTKRDLLSERHETVKAMIGANLRLPDDDADDPIVDLPDALQSAASASNADAIVDAFHPIRELIGDRGLVSSETYQSLRSSQARIRSFVASVASQGSWAFFVVQDATKKTGRWVFFESPLSAPVIELDRIAELLRERLGHDPEPFASTSGTLPDQGKYLEALRENEPKLLPLRRQRVLELARSVLSAYADPMRSYSPQLREISGRLLDTLDTRQGIESDEDTSRWDLRAFTDAFLALVRPYRQEWLANPRHRTELFRIMDLRPTMLERPLDPDRLRAAMMSLPTQQPIERRVVVAIFGVPR